MSDLDNELLELAGGDSSDDEGDDIDQLDQTQVYDDRSPSQEAKPSVEKAEEAGTSRKGVAQKVKARGRRKRKQESEDEDDESSPARDSDDGEADAPGDFDDEIDNVGLGFEGKFHSSSDRDHVMSLPELEREQILAERNELLERKRQDLMLKKALNANKRKASDAELGESTRRSTRPKTEKRPTALDHYKRAREQRGEEKSRLDSARDRRDERSPSTASDRDADGESEVEWAEPASDNRKDEPPAELKDYEHCRVGRSTFAKICFYPKFEESIRGCFARVSIGINRETGQNMYRMTQIKGFADGKPYQMELPNGKKILTDQYAIVTQGPHEKPWPFSACSDSKFTDSEYDRYTDTLRGSSMRLPSRKFLNSRTDSIHALWNMKWDEDALNAKFKKQKDIELKHDPVHMARVKRREILKKRAEALEDGDDETAAQCDNELEALDSSSPAVNGTVKPKPSPSKAQQQDRLAALNRANRVKTQQEVRQALIAERNKILKEREAAETQKMLEVRAKVHGKAIARQEQREALRKEANKNNHDLFGETPDGSRAGTPANGTDMPKETTVLVGNAKKGPVGALKQKNLDDEVIGGLDLGIDLEI